MKLQTKLLAGFIISALITLSVGIFAASRLHDMSKADTVLYTRAVEPMGDLLNIAAYFQRIRLNVLDFISTNNEATKERSRTVIPQFRSIIDSSAVKVEATLISDEARRIIAEYKERRQDFRKLTDTVMAMVETGNKEEAYTLWSGKGREISTAYQKAIDALVASKREQGSLLATHNATLADTSSYLLYIALGFGLLLSITMGVLLTRNIMQQLGEDPGYLASVAGEIARGNLEVNFRAQKRPGGVYHVMQSMVGTMKEKIAEAEEKSAEAARQADQANIAMKEAQEAKDEALHARAEGMLQAANQLENVVNILTSASEELSAQIEQSSRGSDEQSLRISETATAMEQMNATVREVASNAGHASEMSGNARAQAQEGENIVSRVVHGINEVSRQSQEIKQDMDTLSHQAEGIGQIMGVISDIADQTNLLALNAAIEAARAGDAGRGFAVVADEVRKLAEKTMSATHEVGQVISGIQEGTRKSVTGVDLSISTIQEATNLANQSGQTLRSIVELVDQTNDQVRSIAAASEEQSAASEEINRSVEQVATISGQTASAMGQAAQATAELARQSQVLQRLINEMKEESSKI
ncbi:HAMP domain-containing methyl-accepting chemotaxis protein [Desulfovibrio intestinalis]|uniref:Methyl-accepting chemotaxis protein n=1 Tax=Desulfovibrio intestinalis TaxID=58621 RepID=A0A7W8FGX6_9BACT|nr:methyl-accepting chemotaxis protein [Desulfovibrio intestinalis]MBB5144275.1 methyl-accepting chemotaxis protein [Desulfovibrio intestinalis]